MVTITRVASDLIKNWEMYYQSPYPPREDLPQILKGEKTCFTGGVHPGEPENVAPWIVGTVVDYLSRMVLTGDKAKAFYISFMFKRDLYLQRHQTEFYGDVCQWADNLLGGITGLDDKSIENACRLVCFDQIYRCSPSGFEESVKQVYEYPPDEITSNHIRSMVERCVAFFRGKTVTETGFVVKNERIHGDGDILTKTGLWDIKTSMIKSLALKDKLQVLLYWCVGLQTDEAKFSRVKTLGIYNPRQDFLWKLDISQLPEDLINGLKSACEFGYFL